MSEPNPFRRNAHAVIIGINKYQDEKIPDLKLARADAEAVYQILTDPELGRISPDHIILLLDEQATQRNIRSAIGTKIPQRAGEQDMVLIYYAGHGVPVINPKTRAHDGMEKYLAPTDAELDDLRATGIAMDEIQKFFGYIESRQVMFFIDSCYSGEAGGRTFQHPLYQKRAALTNEFLDDLAGEGRMVLTACDVNEVSLEIKNIGHGLFTYHLLEGLKGVADKDRDGLVTIHELYDYVYEKVSQQARRMGGSMHPVQKGSIKGKIFLTQYESAKQKQARALHDQAQSYFDAGKFGEAHDWWRQVIKLLPEHEAAKRGLAEIDRRRQEEQRKAQEFLEQRQAILLNLYHEGKLPSDEFELSLALIEKKENELSALERKTRKLLDDLIDERISVSSYLKSVRLLRKPAVLEKPTPAPSAQPKVEEEFVIIKNEAIKKAKIKKVTLKPKIAKKKSNIQTTQPEKILSLQLRSQPLEGLFVDDIKKMLKEKGFFDKSKHNIVNRHHHQYEATKRHGRQLVIDHATDLIWQQSGSPANTTYADAPKYIRDLNHKRSAGYDDWRLPTIEEAMSLMEPTEKNGILHIDPIFDQKQRYIWTADTGHGKAPWIVSFRHGSCYLSDSKPGLGYGHQYVRAVRSEVTPSQPASEIGKGTPNTESKKTPETEPALPKAVLPIARKEPVRLLAAPKRTPKVQLRSQPAYLFEDDVKKMLKSRNFFDHEWNEQGKGLQHDYEVIGLPEAKLVIDYATGLMWQQSGAPGRLAYSETSNYIYQTLNGKKYAGHKDWRLPTLEEAMSLMEPKERSGGLYIDPVFVTAQPWIWTADQETSNAYWVVFFDSGRCYSTLAYGSSNTSSVRAVRSV